VTKEQSKAVHAPTFIKQVEKFKQCLPARKPMTADFWDRKGMLIVEFMQQGTTMLSEAYCETLKKDRLLKTWNADMCSAPP
jgi:hypothetical protein